MGFRNLIYKKYLEPEIDINLGYKNVQKERLRLIFRIFTKDFKLRELFYKKIRKATGTNRGMGWGGTIWTEEELTFLGKIFEGRTKQIFYLIIILALTVLYGLFFELNYREIIEKFVFFFAIFKVFYSFSLRKEKSIEQLKKEIKEEIKKEAEEDKIREEEDQRIKDNSTF